MPTLLPCEDTNGMLKPRRPSRIHVTHLANTYAASGFRVSDDWKSQTDIREKDSYRFIDVQTTSCVPETDVAHREACGNLRHEHTRLHDAEATSREFEGFPSRQDGHHNALPGLPSSRRGEE